MIDAQNKTTTLYAYQNGIGANTEAILNRLLRRILYGDLYDGGGIDNSNVPIGCEGATNTCITKGFARVWQLVVNDQVLSNDVWGMGGESALISLLAGVGIVYTGSYDRVEFRNDTNEYKTVKFNAGAYIDPNAENTNPTLHVVDGVWTAFCLAPH